MFVTVAHLAGIRDFVGLQTWNAEGHHLSADDVDFLAVLVAVVLHVDIEVHRDGVVAGPSGVQADTAGHAREVGVAVYGQAPIVVI